ncbi:MAG: hypothetical protein HY898_31620 [Deltaproteobacteria bacterium]|nr:hypothetical protein [Deltaproteobacteria bacterium]
MIHRRLALVATCTIALLVGGCGSSSSEPTPAPVGGDDAGTDAVLPEAGSDVTPEAAPDAPAGMKVGEVLEIAPGSDGTLQASIPSSSADESYIAILYSASWAPNMDYTYEVKPATAQSRKRSPAKPSTSRQSAFLHRAHAPWLYASSVTPPPPPPPSPTPGVPPKVGDHHAFKVMSADWTKVLDIDGECIKVGTSLAIWLDKTTTDPAQATVDPAKLNDIVAGFEGTVLPRHHKFFGQESDVDQDGLIHVLYTPVMEQGVVAYFSPCDLANIVGCAAKNNMELIYANPPDLIGSPMMSSVSSILETLAHESQHAIYFHRKHMLNSQVSASENPYVGEALAGMAEDLSGYGNGTFFVWMSALDAMNEVSGPDLLDSSIDSYDKTRDGTLRGAGYLLYRYLYDQAGANEFAKGNVITDKGGVQWMNSLTDSIELGQENIEKVSGRPILDLLFDWYTAILLTNRPGPGGQPLNTEPKYNYLPVAWDPDTKSSTGKDERHGVDPYGQNPMNPNTPLTGPTINEVADASGSIRAGGVEYLRFAGSASGALKFSIQGLTGSNLRLRIVREK